MAIDNFEFNKKYGKIFKDRNEQYHGRLPSAIREQQERNQQYARVAQHPNPNAQAPNSPQNQINILHNVDINLVGDALEAFNRWIAYIQNDGQHNVARAALEQVEYRGLLRGQDFEGRAIHHIRVGAQEERVFYTTNMRTINILQVGGHNYRPR